MTGCDDHAGKAAYHHAGAFVHGLIGVLRAPDVDGSAPMPEPRRRERMAGAHEPVEVARRTTPVEGQLQVCQLAVVAGFFGALRTPAMSTGLPR